MTPQETYKTLENDCFNPLTVDPNPLHDNYRFSLILRLENTPCDFHVKLIDFLGLTFNVGLVYFMDKSAA